MLIAAGITCAHGAAAPAPERLAGISVEGTTLVAHLAGGTTLAGRELEGATLSLTGAHGHTPDSIRIQAVQRDPRDPDGEVLLYHLLVVAAGGATYELCEADGRGERWAFPLRGQWDREGRHLTDAGYTLTCADGAQGKCVRFGYKPWKTLPSGARLDAYHQACVRLVRADYCGGRGTTRDGMLIDVYDDQGIQARDPDGELAGVRFEAAWNPDGAVCVAHTRVSPNATLTSLARECPRLGGRLGAAQCTEEDAGKWGDAVLLYSRSR